MRFFFIFLLVLVFSPGAWAEELADHIVVEKEKHLMTLYNGDKILRTYHITLGKEPHGAKQKEGDLKTPEGFYVISGRRQESLYHLALQISYPDDLDRDRAKRMGVSPGGRIMIHGLPEDFGKRKRPKDWTHGCIAVTNEEIEEIWRLVPDGTPIEIRP